MSRIGKKLIAIPGGVKVSINAGNVLVEGKAKLSMTLPPLTTAEIKDGHVAVGREDDSRTSNAMQGLARSLINNMIIGVTEGFRKELEIVGVGYKAAVSGQKLTLNMGFSHPIVYQVPEGVKVTVAESRMTVVGADKQKVGETAATIRRFRPPEPYKGKGIRYVDERVVLKEGKSAS